MSNLKKGSERRNQFFLCMKILVVTDTSQQQHDALSVCNIVFLTCNGLSEMNSEKSGSSLVVLNFRVSILSVC